MFAAIIGGNFLGLAFEENFDDEVSDKNRHDDEDPDIPNEVILILLLQDDARS